MVNYFLELFQKRIERELTKWDYLWNIKEKIFKKFVKLKHRNNN